MFVELHLWVVVALENYKKKNIGSEKMVNLSERTRELYDYNRNCDFGDAPKHEVEFYAKMLSIFQAGME